ncbi:YeeE/YedE thiosulfate transporter family protein [Siccirubricoccus deserti]
MGWDDLVFWSYWEEPTRVEALLRPLATDRTTVMNLGLIAGAALAAALAGRLRPVWRIPAGEAAGAVVGGLLLGIGAVLAFGCNVSAYFSGIASGSLHGWAWILPGLLGNWVGLRLRPAFSMAQARGTALYSTRYITYLFLLRFYQVWNISLVDRNDACRRQSGRLGRTNQDAADRISGRRGPRRGPAPRPGRRRRAGALAAQGCVGCHGPNGGGIAAGARLSGRDAGELEAILRAYRANERPGTIMPRIARGYTDAEITAVAAYFAAIR